MEAEAHQFWRRPSLVRLASSDRAAGGNASGPEATSGVGNFDDDPLPS